MLKQTTGSGKTHTHTQPQGSTDSLDDHCPPFCPPVYLSFGDTSKWPVNLPVPETHTRRILESIFVVNCYSNRSFRQIKKALFSGLSMFLPCRALSRVQQDRTKCLHCCQWSTKCLPSYVWFIKGQLDLTLNLYTKYLMYRPTLWPPSYCRRMWWPGELVVFAHLIWRNVPESQQQYAEGTFIKVCQAMYEPAPYARVWNIKLRRQISS